MLEQLWPDASSSAPHEIRLRVIDVRDPLHVKTTTVPLPSNAEYSGLIVSGDEILTSHFERRDSASTRGRFYLDRVDISDPGAPVALAKVNVPGVLVSYDARAGRALTSQQIRLPAGQLTAAACYGRFALAEWTSDEGADAPNLPGLPMPNTEGDCVGYLQRLQLVRLDGDRATLEDTYALPESQQVSVFSAGDGALFALLANANYFDPFVPQPDSWSRELLVLSGFEQGQLDVAPITVDYKDTRGNDVYNAPNLFAVGKRALFLRLDEVAILDATDVLHPSVQELVPVIGESTVNVYEQHALLSAGDLGVQVIDFE